jgi:site-specific DNA recombinase
MTRRAALYARVSSDDTGKDGRNLAGQLEMCREYALARDWEVVVELAEDDRGASGASFELEQLGRALEMARAGKIDILVVREIDRLSRKLAKQLIVEEELNRHGVRVEYVLGDYEDSPEGNLMKNVRAVIAEYERLKINERMTRGREQKVKAGHVIVHGHPPFGYRQAERDGKSVLVIDNDEAQVVRMMFERYLEGAGARTIAQEFTDLGIASRGDRVNQGKKRGRGGWAPGTIYDLITNEAYAGTWHYGAKRIPVSVPAIVEPEIWERAQEQRAKNRIRAGRNLKNQYLLRFCMTCDRCGSRIQGLTQRKRRRGTKYAYYKCPANHKGQYSYDCDMPLFRADHADAILWQWIKDLLEDEEAMARAIAGYKAELEKGAGPIRERLAVVNALIADNQHELERLLDLYLSGEFPKRMLVERKSRLELTIGALGRERGNLIVQLENKTLTDEQILTIQGFTAKLRERLPLADRNFEARRGVIESLRTEGRLILKDGKKWMKVKCLVGEGMLQVEPTSTRFH